MTPPANDSLDNLLEQAWALLARGAADPRDDLHWPGLATTDEHGIAQSRVVVLRACRPSAAELELHTDARSEKIKHLQKQPQASLLFYRQRGRIQLRAQVHIKIHHQNATSQQRWQALGDTGKRLYRLAAIPGHPISEPAHTDNELSVEEGFANFVVLLAQVQSLEWLELSLPVHRRARFVFSGPTPGTKIWVAP
jgi:pyridoxamine 5'-phosphate oxidase